MTTGIGTVNPVDVPVAADEQPWQIGFEQQGQSRWGRLVNDFGDGRVLTYRLPIMGDVTLDGHRARMDLGEFGELRWSSYRRQVKLEVAFAAKPPLLTFDVQVGVSGDLQVVETGGGAARLVTGGGATVAELPVPWLRDAAGGYHVLGWAWSGNQNRLRITLPNLPDELWPGALLDPTTVTAEAFRELETGRWLNQSKVARAPDGTLWVTVIRGAGYTVNLYRSTDGGATWQEAAGTFAPAQHVSLFADQDGHLHCAYENRAGFVVYRRMEDPSLSSPWGPPVTIAGGSSLTAHRPDVVAYRVPSSGNYEAQIVFSRWVDFQRVRVGYRSLRINGDTGAVTSAQDTNLSTTYTAVELHPSIDLRHNGDGATPKHGSPDLACAWTVPGQQGIMFRRAAYSPTASATHSWHSAVTFSPGYSANHAVGHWTRCLYDGERWLVGGRLNSRFVLHTTTDSGVWNLPIDVPVGNDLFGSFTYDDERNIIVVGRGASGSAVYRVWNRVAGSFGGYSTLVPSGAASAWVHTSRGNLSGAVDVVVMPHGGGVSHLRILNHRPPFAPALTTVEPFSAADDHTFQWLFQDPNVPWDFQSAYELTVEQVGGGSIVGTGKVPSTASEVFVSGGTFTNDRLYRWRVRVWDSADLASPWSDWQQFYVGLPPDVTPVNPPPDGVVELAFTEVAWDFEDPHGHDQAHYRVLVEGTGGVLLDTGKTPGTATRQVQLDHLDNESAWTVTLEVWNVHGRRAVATWDFTVQYLAPPAPQVTVTPQPDKGCVEVKIVNPGSVGNEPEAMEQDVWRRIDGGAWVRLGHALNLNVMLHDYAAPAARDLEYRVRVLAFNDTTSTVITEPATLDLQGVWLHLAHDPAGTIHGFLHDGAVRGDRWRADHAFLDLDGRAYPVMRWGEQVAEQVEQRLTLFRRPDRLAFDRIAQARQLVVYRDSQGLRVYGVIPERSREWRHVDTTVELVVHKVAHEESV